MKLRFRVSLRTLLVFSLLLKNSHAQCAGAEDCGNNQTISANTTTTTVEFSSPQSCNFSVGGELYEGPVISGLSPGTVHHIILTCFNCCAEFTTRPVQPEDITAVARGTDFINITWSLPLGRVDHYSVNISNEDYQYSNTTTATAASFNRLKPGTLFVISVTAVAGSFRNTSAPSSFATHPEAVKNLTVINATTSSVFVRWTEPEGKSSFYTVQWTDGEAESSQNVTETFRNISSLTAGVQHTVTVTAVAGDNTTKGTEAKTSVYTHPEAVKNLTVINATTSSVFVRWTEPEGNRSFYTVQWTDGEAESSQNVTETFINISSLTAGVQHTVTVTAVAGDNTTKGTEAKTSVYTHPEAVKNLTVINATTSSVFVRWTEPEGNSSFYTVQWTDGEAESSQNVTETFINISSLTAGVQHTVRVTAVAGDNTTKGTEAKTSVYTHPEAVKNLTVINATTSSVFVRWTDPEGKSSFYTVQWTDGEAESSQNVTETFLNISSLTAGVQHTVTVTAVAGDNTTKGTEAKTSVYTHPEAVKNLTVINATTSSVFVRWTEPEGNRSFYTVQWTDGEAESSQNVTETFRNISSLTAGMQHTVTVTAVAGDNTTKGTEAKTSVYTHPEAVKNLTVINATTSSVFVRWTEPEGNRSFYTVQWTDGEAESSQNVTETFLNISSLTAGVQHTVTVTAVAGDNTTKGTEAKTSVYTHPEAVKNLTVINATTSSVFVRWTEPEGNRSFYTVQWTDGEAESSQNVTETFRNISSLTAGVQYTVTVTAVAGDNTTKGTEAKTSVYTHPEAVKNLTVINATTSSVFVRWTEPEGNRSFYTVQWTDGEAESSQNVTETFRNISSLTAGVQHTVTVTAVAGDNTTKGTEAKTSVYTQPGTVSDIVMLGTTTNMSVSWTAAEGQVDSYTVLLYRKDQLQETNPDLSSNTTNTLFQDLNPGQLYWACVVTKSGPLSANSTTSNATFPNPPGPISVTSQTTQTINFTWAFPDNMDIDQYNFTVSYLDNNNLTRNNWFLLEHLQSGTAYQITVRVVAALGYQSTPVMTTNYTTPYPVTELRPTEISTNSMTLLWDQQEFQSYYSYVVKVTNGTSTFQSKIVNDTTHNVTGLLSGTNYSFTVTTQTPDGTKATPVTRSYFTQPGTVSDIVMLGTTTNMSVSWTAAEGQVDSYTVLLYRKDQLQETNSDLSSNTTNTLFQDLNPGQLYWACVVTKSGPLSANSTTSNATYPNPPGPISVTSQTTQTINFTWAFPDNMDIDQYNFTVSYLDNNNLTRNNWFLLEHLQSGTAYQITVRVVAALGYQSTPVMTTNYTTPYPVTELRPTEISTNSMTLLWDQQEFQSYYSYVVKVTNGTSTFQSKIVNDTTHNVTGLLSGTNYSFTVTTQTPDGTKATPVTRSYFTRPYSIPWLEVTTLNTTAVYLNWTKPLEYKDEYKYRIETSGCDSQNKTVADDFTMISELTPGTNCTFCVFVRAQDGTEGQSRCKSQYTKPGTVSDIVMLGTTTNMSVSWTAAEGQVDSYTVLLYRKDQLQETNSDLSSNTTNTLFQDLNPGQLYWACVVTKSGPLSANSTTSNATYPNPPGPISVTSQTTQTINFTWAFPDNMDIDQYNFTVSYLDNNNLTRNNWFLLEHLQSGTAYQITVRVVAALGYQSTPVMTTNYTRPYPVTELRPTEISTNSMTLLWAQQEIKPSYSYVVKVTNGTSTFQSKVVNNTTHNVTGLLSGTNYSFTVTTQTPDGTRATPVTRSYFTRPYSIPWLEVTTLNATAVYLNWTKPLEYNDEYKYRIETSGCDSQNKTVADDFTAISELTPGTNCTFCVFVRAQDGTEGQSRCKSQYTKPEAVQPSVSSEGSNHSIVVSWTHPQGNVEYYVVQLYNTSSSMNQSVEVNSSGTSHTFEGLSAGSLYTAVVVTVSGPFSVPSKNIMNATFPNPPGPVSILWKTTDSLLMRWDEAPLMTNTPFHYLVTRISSQGHGSISTNYTSHTFTSLLSGTSYNLSVVTVGSMGFKSHKVQRHMVTTRPMSVKSIIISTKEDSVTLTWVQPEDYKAGYRYNLTWLSSNGTVIGNDTTVDNERKIGHLVPGSMYNFTVTTETSDGTQGAPKWISNCTNASPVSDLRCESPNGGKASVILSWSETAGLNSGFHITAVNNTSSMSYQAATCNQLCNHTVSNLAYSTEYSLTVVTLSCGQPSTPVSHSCTTGITNPPIPPNSDSLMKVEEKDYNRFSIQINSSLLDASHGPITNIGVLVTNNIHGLNTSHLGQYLVKTYQEWNEHKTDAYLAVIRENNLQSRSGVSQLTIDIGDSKTSYGYTNGALNPKETYWYAVVLFTQLELNNDLVKVDSSLLSVTEFASVQLPPNLVVIGIAVGATLGIFCVLFVILIGFIVYMKRFSKKESPDIQIHSLRSKVSVAVRVEEFEAYYKRQKADSNCGFAEEYEELKVVGTAQSKVHALSPENKPKNRYNNVLPYDSSRVKLSIIHGSPYEDYINANYIPGYNSKKEFIAAQGPLPSTAKDFWRMIWEKNVQTLVMLTGCIEQGRVKCEQYWDHGTKHYENITVTTTSEIPLEDWIIRDFDIKNLKTAETRSVRHFHFTAWPDHGVPDTTELIISFRHLVREHMNQYSKHSPTVVHCSAGVGRTGTFISIDRLCFQIEQENTVDVFGIVHDMRMHRCLMVQTEDQYVFLNQCALDIIRSRTGTNVDLIYQNTAAFAIYENVEPKKGFHKNGYRDT